MLASRGRPAVRPAALAGSLISHDLFDEFNGRIDALVRARDWPSAQALCRSYLANAEA